MKIILLFFLGTLTLFPHAGNVITAHRFRYRMHHRNFRNARRQQFAEPRVSTLYDEIHSALSCCCFSPCFWFIGAYVVYKLMRAQRRM